MTGPLSARTCSRPSTRVQAKTRASGRIQVGRLTRRIARAGHERFQDGNSTGSLRGVSAAGARVEQRAQLTDVAGGGESAFVDRRLKGVLECHHQLDAIERTQAQLFDRRIGREIVAAGVLRQQRGQAVAACSHRARCAAGIHPVANDRSLEFARPLRPRQLLLGPDQRAANFLVIGQFRVGLPDDGLDVRAAFEYQRRRARVPRCRFARRRPPHREPRRCASARARRLPERHSALPA